MYISGVKQRLVHSRSQQQRGTRGHEVVTPRATWNAPEPGVCKCIATKEEAAVAGTDTWTPLHSCRSAMTPRPSRGRVLPPAYPVPACTTLALLLCSLVQLAVTSLQLPASSPGTTRLLDHSEVFTQHAFLKNTTLPLSHLAPTGGGITGAGGGRHDPAGGLGHIPPVPATTTPAGEDLPPHHTEKDTLHAPARSTRSITPIRRVEMHGPPVTDRKTLYVEVVVVADNSLYKHYGTGQRVQQRVTQVFSVANRVLGSLGVVLVPTRVEVWDRGDHIRVTSRLDTNIDGLQRHRLSLMEQYPPYPNDHTVLLTRTQRLGRESCGAPIGGMCRKQQSVSVVQDEGRGPSVTGVALAHQVGHSLGMQDDATDPDHTCTCAASTCVMSRHFGNASTPDLAWSACSRQSFNSALETLALDCLRNIPKEMYSSSSCGDGVVDDGEQCDCGPHEFCDNPCCDAATCRLTTSASCASGSCCDIQTCKPKPPGAVCRAAVTECDLPEFCSGHSEYCPKDVTKANGEPCHEGHCFSGECGSRERQCKRRWGPSASVASPDCYAKLNVRGNHAGNCGMKWGGFRRCEKQESLCGTLHCVASAPSSRLLHEHRNGSKSAGPHKCDFISGSENYPDHHWLTPNGASCGSGKMCINQRCEDVPQLTGACHDGCSGHGVCNSLGHCHCNAGFAPPNCSLPGLGGSVDSNVMSDASDFQVLIRLAWVVVVLLFSLLAVTCCMWGCWKGWYKRKGRDTISGNLPCCTACLDACCCPVMTKTARWMLTVGSSSEKRLMKTNIEVEEGANEHMLCSVDVDVKGSSHMNSWGTANNQLVTEVVTVEPKDSPDFRRKVTLPPDSPLMHHRSVDNLQRPKYQHSISKDSGCVSDTDEDTPSKRNSLQLSMGSLVSILMKFGNKKPKTLPESEGQQPKSLGSQKSIPLSRFVVDPLAGRLSSRQGTPPPDHARPSYNRSFSTDVVSTRGHRKEGTPPPPPPAALKPNKSAENLWKASEMPNCSRFPMKQNSPPADAPTLVSVSPEEYGAQNVGATTTSKAPLKPPKNKPLPSPPKVPPLKLNYSPKAGNQRNYGGTRRPSIPNGASRPSPSKSLSGSRDSSPGSTAANKVMEMARKFEAA